ncbi:MAG: hypothetical protein AAGA34_14905 [Pseudomonadota bacterium]
MTLAPTIAAVLLAAQASAEPTPPAPPAAPPAPCASDHHRAFDFWIGEWDVFVTGSDEKAGESLIERVSNGCAIRETWMPMQGEGGTSLSLLNHRSDRWEQLWIGSDGRRVDFIGGAVDGRMVLTGYWDDIGGPGRDGLIRMTFTAHPDGSVHQFGQASGGHGLGWVTSFDFTYRPKSNASSGKAQ